MTIPYKEWRDFHIVTLEGHDDNVGSFNNVAYWTNVFRDYGIVGGFMEDDAPLSRWLWYTLIRPSASNFELKSGANIPANYRFDFHLTKHSWDAQPCADCDLEFFAMDNPGNRWISGAATGKYIDGLAINWDNYPINEGYIFSDLISCRPFQEPPLQIGVRNVLRTDVVGDPTPPPLLIETEMASNFGAHEACKISDKLFRNGLFLKIDGYGGGGLGNLGVGNQITLNVLPERLKVKYFNPVVNSFSRYQIPVINSVNLIINGMGFDNNPDEINDLCGVNADVQWGTELTVSTIKFYTTAGVLAGTITTGAAEFTVNSDLKITIPAATFAGLGLAEGAYHVLLTKGPLTDCGAEDADGYAGDWRCSSSGLMSEGNRFVLLVRDNPIPEDPPIIRTKWPWLLGDTEVDEYYAPQDTRGSEHFYSGRLKSVSPFTRSIDDKTGLFSISDMNVTLANPDKKFSKLLAEYWLKNQIIEFFYGRGIQPEAWQSDLFQGIIDDYSLKGPHFDVVIKDIIQKYFQIKLPLHICTKADYPNIHESALGGKVRPAVIGNASLIPAVAGEKSGSVEALYIDTVNHSYLAADFSLYSVTEVYSKDILKATPADYSIAYRDGGRTYIDFTADQGDNRITFNSKGCSVPMWDSSNGYLQNPAYIISFLLTQLMGMPINFLNMDSFDVLAGLFEVAGWHQSGLLVLQGEARDAWSVLQELLFTCGAKLWPAKDGRLTIGRKDITNYKTDLFIFEQLDLWEPPNRPYNLPAAVNFANAKWNYAPAHSAFQGSMEKGRESSITKFGKEIMEEWSFPWTTSESMVSQRMTEELLKRGFGDPKVEFPVSMKKFVDTLDIFSNFRLQDPWGLSKTGEGERGRYYYVESLSYDPQNEKIDVVGIDMQWLLRQYFIFGDRNALPHLWANSEEADRMFGYFCNRETGLFADLEPGKFWADRKTIGE